LLIANRTASKAIDLAKEFEDLGAIQGTGLADLATYEDKGKFDLIINATSTGLSGGRPEVPEALIASGACAYDMVYGAQPTEFMQWAQALGCQVSDGLGMLVGQAAESFYVWRGVRPDVGDLIAEIRASL